MNHDQHAAGVIARPIFPEFSVRPMPLARWTFRYRAFKRLVDIAFSLAVLPYLVVLAIGLWIVNPFLNPGPVFYRQSRMGMGGTPFMLWKFRTMVPNGGEVRAYDAPVEHDRITRLGHFMRMARLDEIPNALNILSGEMTLIGPRPDAWDHAIKYIEIVPYYCDRLRVKPGITGLAQVRSGYADCPGAVHRKARLDRYYVRKSRIKLDLLIMRATFRVMLTGWGAK
jgi:lipopolysaccharide/colanic/teichoic acid biosynthesis glycosyltransferase